MKSHECINRRTEVVQNGIVVGERVGVVSDSLCAKRVEKCFLDIAYNTPVIAPLPHRLVLLTEEPKAAIFKARTEIN